MDQFVPAALGVLALATVFGSFALTDGTAVDAVLPSGTAEPGTRDAWFGAPDTRRYSKSLGRGH